MPPRVGSSNPTRGGLSAPHTVHHDGPCRRVRLSGPELCTIGASRSGSRHGTALGAVCRLLPPGLVVKQQGRCRGCAPALRAPMPFRAAGVPVSGFVKGEAAGAPFGFSCFGFLASRLPRCSPLATGSFLLIRIGSAPTLLSAGRGFPAPYSSAPKLTD